MSKIQQTHQSHVKQGPAKNQASKTQKPDLNMTQMLEAPETLRSDEVLSAQQTVGNQVVQRALDKSDQRKGLTDEQGNLRKDLTEQIQQKRGGGTSLPGDLQKEASKKLGKSFKDVRIHTDDTADKLSRTINARAFTIGKDIFFKGGVFSPGSNAGRETIMHELTHVVQQGGKSSASSSLKLGAPNTSQEKEADTMGKKHATSVNAAPAGAVQREADEEEMMMQAEEDEMVQAQGEEDELQMQNDDEELQMQGDEEEMMMQDDDDAAVENDSDADDDAVMMQAEDDELQMQGDEEEMMMQEDEEEVQMQADSVVQRAWEEDKENGGWKKKPGIVSAPAPKTKKTGVGATIDLANQRLGKDAPIQLSGADPRKIQKTQFQKTQVHKSLMEKIGGKEKQVTGKSMGRIFHLEAKGKEKFDETFGKQHFQKEKASKEQEEKDTKQKKVDDAKQKWMSTLKDPSASKDDIAKAKEKLGTFHKDVGEEDFKSAHSERSKALEEAAKSGDDKAFETMKSEKASQDKEFKDKHAEEKQKFDKTVPGQRRKLMETLKNPQASKDDVKAAKGKLKDLHKDAFSKKDFKAAKAERKTAMKEAAERGDEEAYKNMKAEQEDTFSGRTKKAWKEEVSAPAKEFRKNLGANTIKGVKKGGKLLGKAGLALGKGIGKVVGNQLTTGVSHFLGVKADSKDDDDDKKEDKKSGGGGMGAIMEEYSKVLEKNKTLEKRVAELEGAKK